MRCWLKLHLSMGTLLLLNITKLTSYLLTEPSLILFFLDSIKVISDNQVEVKLFMRIRVGLLDLIFLDLPDFCVLQ